MVVFLFRYITRGRMSLLMLHTIFHFILVLVQETGAAMIIYQLCQSDGEEARERTLPPALLCSCQ